jgi:hypothetical protein
MLGTDRRRTALAATLFVVLTALVAVSSAHGAGWRPGVDVSVPQTSSSCGFLCSNPGASGVDVAVNSQGDVVLSWFRREGSVVQVQAAFRPAGGSFGPAQTIGTTQGCFLCFLGPNSDAAIDDAGRAVVVWTTRIGSNNVVAVSTKAAGGNFTTGVPLSDSSQTTSGEPRLAMSRNGHTIVVWTLTTPNPDVIQFSSRTPGGAFSAATGLSATSNATTPDAAITDTGAATVTWGLGSPSSVQSRTRTSAAGTFNAVQTLSAAGQSAISPDVAMDAQSRATVVWSRFDGTQDRIQSRPLNPDGTPAAGVDEVSEVGRDGTQPQIALSPSNAATATWIDCAAAGGDCVVATASRPSGASFGAPLPVSAPGDSNFLPRVVSDAAGTATIAWSQFGTTARIQTIRRAASGTPSGVDTLSSTSGAAFSPQLAVDGQGSVVAGWNFSRTADNFQSAQFAVFDAAPPELRNLSFSNGRALQPLGFSVAPFDRYSPVSANWAFGDGTSLPGPAVTKTFGGAGTFNAVVTATDAVGNSAQASGAVQVGQPDLDGDGFPQGQDCDDGNAKIFPGATEIRGNKVDENCDGVQPDFLRIAGVTLSHDFAAFRNGTRFSRFQVKRVPRGSTVKASCKIGKRKCPGKARRAFTKKRARGTVSLKKRYVRVFLPARAKITVRVTKSRRIGAVKIMTIRKARAPKVIDRCVRPGSRRIRRC